VDAPKRKTRRKRAFGLVSLLMAALAISFAIAGSASAKLAAAPANTSPPTISGTAQQGQTLTAGTGSWSGNAPISFTYDWQRCDTSGGHCGDIKGATGATYTLAKQDVNHTVRVVVTGQNSEGAATAVSAVTGSVSAPLAPPPAAKPGAPVNTSLPTISGSVREGQTLTASTGSWSGTAPISFTYAWERCDTGGGHCGNIGGSNHATYTVQNADAGKTLRVVVTAKNSVGNTSATSAFTGVVAAAAPAAPAGVSLAPSTFRALYGSAITLSGTISTKQGGETVTIEAQAYGSAKPDRLGTVTTSTGGTWSFRAKPTIQTTYDAQWKGATSSKATVGVMPLVTFHVLTHKRFSTRVVAARSFAGKLVQFQRHSSGRWVTMKRVRLGANSSAIFTAKLPKGTSTLRIAFSVNQAGAGYLGGISRMITYPLHQT
jgi:hypothetical protein